MTRESTTAPEHGGAAPARRAPTRAPLGVQVVASLLVLVAGGGVLLALAWFAVAPLASLGLVVVAAVPFVLGVGLWNLRAWAYVLVQFLAAVGTVAALLGRHLVPAALGVAVFAYLLVRYDADWQ